MSIATLQDIIVKFRKLTVTGNTLQITDSQIIDYINSFYLYDFPAQFRSLKLKDLYFFNTQRGIDTYPFDSEHYTTIESPCYCMNREIKLFQNNPWNFYGANYNWQFQQNFANGNGTDGPYTGTVQSTPVLRSVNNNPRVQTTLNSNANFITSPSKPSFPETNISRVQNVLITANVGLGNTLNVTDDGNGTLIGDVNTLATNTINYDTGAIQLTFSAAVPGGENIQIQYNPQKLSIPLSILFYQNQFTLRPVPDRGYTISLVAYRTPSQVLLGTMDPDNPVLTGQAEQNEWWECLAFGAAKKFYEDKLDPDGIMLMEKSLKERYDVAETRTYAQLGKQRASTIYADQLSNNYGGTGWGFNQGV